VSGVPGLVGLVPLHRSTPELFEEIQKFILKNLESVAHFRTLGAEVHVEWAVESLKRQRTDYVRC